MQIFKEDVAIIAFGVTTLSGFVLTWFKMGKLYQRFLHIEENSGKIDKGVKAEEMSVKHESSISNIQSLCRMRGEQLGRLEAKMEMVIENQHSTNTKIDGLANSLINLANHGQPNHYERND